MFIIIAVTLRKMTFNKMYVFALVMLSTDAAMSVQNSLATCGQFPASFVAVIDQNIDSPFAIIEADPDLIFFKDVLKFRENAIQNTFDDAITFFKESYGLDFASSSPNEQNQYFYQNSTLGSFKFADDIENLVTLNNWIQTGSTRSTCYRIDQGGIIVRFSGEQTLHGTYGGSEGKTVGPNNFLSYGFYSIRVCQQSPVIIQYQSRSPVRQEPVNGTSILDFDLYSRVLGNGKAQGLFTTTPSVDDPGKYRLVTRNVFTFEQN